MKITEHQLKEIYQRNTNRQRRSDCPASEELYELLSASLNSSDRKRLVAHLEQCHDCAEEFRIAGELSGQLTKASKATSWKKYARPVLAAAAMILCIAAGIFVYRNAAVTTSTPVERGEQSTVFWTTPESGAILENAPSKLTWSAIPDVKTYHVVLLNYASATIIQSGPLNSTEFVLPENVKQSLDAGQVYYWRIEYERAGTIESRLLRFNIR